MPSTVISSFDYLNETSILRITFVSGLIYNYLHVPEEVYTAMKSSFHGTKALVHLAAGYKPLFLSCKRIQKELSEVMQ